MTRRPRRPARRLAACAALLAVATAGLAFGISAQAAKGPWNYAGLSQPYSFSSCGAGRHAVDPINVVWWGFDEGGYHWHAVTTRLEHWVGWTHNDYKDVFGIIHTHVDYQYTIHPNGTCSRDLAQRADDCRVCNRNHVRVMYGNSKYLVGDAHHDSTVFCDNGPLGLPVPAHVAGSYDSPENQIVSRWRKHAPVKYGYWGDTRTMIQCNGSHVRSSGYPAFAYSG